MKIILPLYLLCATFVSAADMPVLDVSAANVKKKEVRHSMIGFRDTLIFYTFVDKKAVLRLNIANKDASFPVKGTLYLFESTTTAEGMSKWLNNQYSDGLFPNIPTPALTKFMPDDFASVTAKKKVGQSDAPVGGGVFDNYDVTVKVRDHQVDERVKIKGFSVDTKVHVKR